MDLELWTKDGWVRQEIGGTILARSWIQLSDGRILHPSFWRLYGTKPYCGVGIFHGKRKKDDKKPVSPRFKQKVERVVAGPFTKKELWMAEKMCEGFHDRRIFRRRRGWFVERYNVIDKRRIK